MKFIVLSFKIKGLLNIMKTRSGRSQDSIFHEFVTVLGDLEELLDDIVASLLEVGFSMDFEEVPWLRLRQRGSGEGKSPVSGRTNKQLGDISDNI